MSYANRPEPGDVLWIDSEERFSKAITDIRDESEKSLVTNFQRRGFVHLPNAVPTSTIDKAVGGFEEWLTENASDLVRSETLPRIVNLHGARDEFKDLFCDSPTVVRTVDALMGYECSVYTSLTFKFGTQQPIHIDAPVFEPNQRIFLRSVGCVRRRR